MQGSRKDTIKSNYLMDRNSIYPKNATLESVVISQETIVLYSLDIFAWNILLHIHILFSKKLLHGFPNVI